jgi:hypothetical protein
VRKRDKEAQTQIKDKKSGGKEMRKRRESEGQREE